MSGRDYDLFVIGAGSGGVRASRMAAQYGARVGICEESRVGGTCVIRGCVPKKLMVYASHFAEDFEDAAGFGWQVGERSFDWTRLIENKDREIDRLNGIYKQILAGSNVELFESRGELLDAHTVQLADRQVTADNILIATGGWPRIPEFPGSEHVITSNECFHLDRLPGRIAIAGGGYIAVEFAGIFNGLGSEVTQFYRGPQILRGFDCDVRDAVETEMAHKGVKFRYNSLVEHLQKTDDGLLARFSDGHSEVFDQLMCAIGRVPKTSGLGLERVGVAIDAAGAVMVDDYSCSSVKNIYAVGDVTNRINLTPVALKEGMAFARTVYGGEKTPVDHDFVPSAVFSQPPVASTGLTEEQARESLGEIDIYRSSFRPLKHTLSGRDEKTMMKLIVERDSQKVIGCHIVGMDAAEILQGYAVAIKMGATKDQFDATVGIHPTAAEEFVTMREPVASKQGS
jgi:glutathione reductase (NADPH)